MRMTRRDLGRLLGAGLLLPSPLLAAGSDQRKFLFIFCSGGWDPTYVFTPHLGDPDTWMDPGGTPAEAHGIPFLSHPDRPSVDTFFETWGDRTALIQGLEVRSITHEACRRIIWTGGTDSAADDWAARIAGNSGPDWALPDLVLSGPAFSAEHSGAVMRVGPDGQLGKLVTGLALDESDIPAAPLSSATTDQIEAYLNSRSSDLLAATPTDRFAQAYAQSLSRLDGVRDIGEDLSLASLTDDYVHVRDRIRPAIRLLAENRSRCVVAEHLGEWDIGWDSHSNIAKQGDHFEVLMADLNSVLAELAVTPTSGGGRLLDELTVVVLSEMGRAPWLNTLGGKDHWTFTSAMLIGSGVRGGTVTGGYGSGLVGQPVDLETGLVTDSGTRLSSAHLGATLSTLAGLDAEAIVPGAEPIWSVMSESG